MILEVVIAFVVLLLVMAGMAVGVMVTGRRISGSCGGLSAISGVDECGVCGRSLNDGSKLDCSKQRS